MTNEEMLENIYDEIGDVKSVERKVVKDTKNISLDHIMKRFHTWEKFTKEYLTYCVSKRSDVKVTTKVVGNKDVTKKTV